MLSLIYLLFSQMFALYSLYVFNKSFKQKIRVLNKMSGREQLRIWLEGNEIDSESVVGQEYPDEV